MAAEIHFFQGQGLEEQKKNGDSSGHRVQEVTSLQALTKRVTLRFNV